MTSADRRVAQLRATLVLAGVAMALSLLAATAARAAWQLYPLPAPPGGQFSTPAGYPGDLSFWAPNRGLMTVGGNGSVPEGVYSWDGVGWHQLATVCGGDAKARIAWAGPTEYWTITRPSLPRPRFEGFALCHFKDGEVVGSYSAPTPDGETYHELEAAACLAPDDCWFGGVGGASEDGTRIGAFHLHWDGQQLRTVYAPQGRAVSDLLPFAGGLLESSFVGARPSEPEAAVLRDPEDPPLLLRQVADGQFAPDLFTPRSLAPAVPSDGTELRALDAEGVVAWAVGGGADSGPASAIGTVPRLPFAARLAAGGAWTELPIQGAGLDLGDTFVDVALVPGGAWAALSANPTVGIGTGGGALGQPRVAFIADDGTTTVETLAGAGDPLRGEAVRIACPAANDCWLATARGYLYRWGEAGAYPQDTDPAFQGTISVRPNEAAEQVIPDTPPEDDSLLNAPPTELPKPAAELPACRTIRSTLSRVRVGRAQPLGRAASRYRLTIRFRLARRARIGLVARRDARVVARVPTRKLRPGRHSVRLTLVRDRWPNRMRFVVEELALPKQPPCSGARDDGLAYVTATPRIATR